jgi:ADP-heptose:LPS heptosyltransferase
LPQCHSSFVKGVKFDLPHTKCYIFALLKSMKLLAANASASNWPRLCVIFPGALGDFICFLPALQTLARSAEIDLFARSEYADLVPPKVTVGSMERTEIRELFVADAARAKSFFGSYAAVYSWFGSQQETFVRRLLSVTCGRAKIFPFRPANGRIHQAEHYLNCLDLGAGLAEHPMIKLLDDDIHWGNNFSAKHGLDRCPVLTMAAGSGAREKNWPEEFFIAVTEWWRTATGGTAVLLVGPVEQERGGLDRLRSRCVVASELRLSQAAALLHRTDLYLGNDSGISHLAAALGKRTVALFGPSDVEQWAPRGERVTVIRRAVECSPCQLSAMKNCLHRSCLTALHPGEVIEALAQIPEVVTLTRQGAGIKV